MGSEGSEAGVFVVNIKREYFSKIVSGKKTVEYRDITPYWTNRLRTYTHRS